MGGVGTKPWRVPAVEEALRGQLPDAVIFRAAAERRGRGRQRRARATLSRSS